jgi:hypothetical protein
VAAFHIVRVVRVPDAINYAGPVILEVTDISDDRASETRIRSDVGTNFETVQKYLPHWLDQDSRASHNFYFGYTHGQRIWSYLYPRTVDDLNSGFEQWSGKINQFENIKNILSKEGKDSRQAYLVFPHPTVDNPKSDWYREKGMAPSLLGIHFRIEPASQLSGFAFLRSQELSLFSVVNYLEVKDILKKLHSTLKRKYSDLKLGRIVMMSSLGYFDPGTVLLDKPTLCKMGPADIAALGAGMGDLAKRQNFVEMLHEYAERNYQKIDTDWCEILEKELRQNSHGNRYCRPLTSMRKKLESLAKKKAKHSISGMELLDKKKEIVEAFIERIEAIS